VVTIGSAAHSGRNSVSGVQGHAKNDCVRAKYRVPSKETK
jgi:hypothetical protein